MYTEIERAKTLVGYAIEKTHIPTAAYVNVVAGIVYALLAIALAIADLAREIGRGK